MLSIFANQPTQADIFASAASVNTEDLSGVPMTLAEHAEVFKNIVGGVLIDPNEVRSNFERLVRDVASVKAELSKCTVKELEKKITSLYRKSGKAELVETVYNGMLNQYGFLTVKGGVLSISGFGHDARVIAIRAKLASLTAETLAEYRQAYQDAQEAHKKRFAGFMQALEKPETLEDFNLFIKHKGESALTPEQQQRRDELVAESLRQKKATEVAAKAQVEGVAVEAGMSIIQTKHTRDNYDLFVVKLGERVDADKFKSLVAAAKRLGGWYSSYSKDGAIPGFQFKEMSNAEAFVALGRGETVDASERVQARQQSVTENAVERLRAMADRLEEAANDQLNRDRKTNTARRARMASSAEASARANLAFAATMRNIAAAIGRGEATHLHGLRDKAQIETLYSIISSARVDEIRSLKLDYNEETRMRLEPPTAATVQFVKFPRYTGCAQVLSSIIKTFSGQSGFKRLCARLEPYLAKAEKADDWVPVPDEIADEFFDKLGEAAADKMPWYWGTINTKQKRLKRMGIETPEQLRMACREFIQFREVQKQADKAVELERALVGMKVGIDFFPTPRDVAQRMVEIAKDALESISLLEPAEWMESTEWLEPSAGNGNIASEIREAGFEPDVVEISSSLREILEAKEFNLVGWDFLDLTDRKYHAIVMNPPFGNNTDIAHVRHAYSLLEEKGAVVSIVGEGAFHRDGETEKAFRDWLDSINATVEKLPEGTFTDPRLMATTGANGRLVTIIKR